MNKHFSLTAHRESVDMFTIAKICTYVMWNVKQMIILNFTTFHYDYDLDRNQIKTNNVARRILTKLHL